MRFLALFSVLCSIAATILSVLLIVAGNRVGFLEDVDLLTLNTTNVGQTLATSPGSPVYSAISNPVVTAAIASNPLASEVAGQIGNVAQSVAESIGLHEFYSLHLLDYCEGTYSPSAKSPGASKNVTACSNSSSLWTFDLEDILQSELHAGIALSAIQWPPEVSEGLRALETAMRVMFAFYCAAAGASGVSLLLGLLGLALDGRGSACVNVVWISLTTVIMIVASIIATIVMSTAAGVVNRFSDDVGVEAYKGNKFLAMTWAAVAVLVLGWFVWCFDCCVGGSRNRYRYKQAEKEVY